jgi:hypothetical protein
MQRFLSNQADATKLGMGDTSTLGFDFADLMTRMMTDPTTVAKAQIDLFNESVGEIRPIACSGCKPLRPIGPKTSASSTLNGPRM